MFEKILIANRGEIACRIIRTCRRLEIATVAVCSEADADALHVRMADEAVLLGPPPAGESYLKIDRIVAAARETGAEAVHPGYGFLSENAAFAEALVGAGIAFIGPPAQAIRLMGDKIEAKRLAAEAGVSTVPGHPDPVRDYGAAAPIAERIGYPVMIKAAAGGGGKGMRIAAHPQELHEGLERARSEARSSFGDDRVFLEKYIREPRHIEIQVLADRHGRVIHLGERECSIQRRHQKVIEEAPSPLLDPATRAAMGAQAVALARAVGYHSAGTVEFIADAERNFYFLEMNTRLQVEHPVTELTTGLDLVEQMLRVAAGEPLGLSQDQVEHNGWALEARVYAEDPARGFLPSSGRLRRYLEPAGEGIRVDSGVVEGSDVPMFYDPMIAKVCAYGPDRATATARLGAALDSFYIRGLGHNVGFLAAVLGSPRFGEGRLSTDFIADEFGERFEPALDDRACHDLAAAAVAMRLAEAHRAASISGRMADVRIASAWVVLLDRREIALDAELGTAEVKVLIEGRRFAVTHDWRPGLPLARVTIDDGWCRTFTLQVDRHSEGYRLSLGGSEVVAVVRPRRAAELAARIPAKAAPDTSKVVLSPMPGLIVSIPVRAGETVKAGQELLVLEAMKMENVLRAERDGVIEAVQVEPGATVAADEILITFG
jgi:propionyl-CoA carboxylase alpha chain